MLKIINKVLTILYLIFMTFVFTVLLLLRTQALSAANVQYVLISNNIGFREEVMLIVLPIVIGLYLLVVNFNFTAVRQILVDKTTNGLVVLDERALEDFVSDIVHNTSGVNTAKVAFDTNKKRELFFDVDLLIFPNCNVTELTNSLQQKINDSLLNTIGKPASKINLNVKGIESKSK